MGQQYMNRFYRWFQVVAASALMGGVYGVEGCASAVLHNVNPCGTILNCDPIEYDNALNDHFPDYSKDPTCTIPGFCGGTPFPGTGGAGGNTNPPSDSGTGSGVTVTTGGISGTGATNTGT